MNKHFLSTLLVPSFLALLLIGCGKKVDDEPEPSPGVEISKEPSALEPSEMPFYADTCLPGSIELYDIERVGAVQVIRPADFERMAGMEVIEYRHFSLVGLAKGEYRVAQVPVRAEVAQFATPEDAYGYHACMRPDGTALLNVGAEAYEINNTLCFVTSEYAVRIATDGDEPEHRKARSRLAHEINGRLFQTLIPQFFGMYPKNFKVEPSTHYYPSDFLGVKGLDKVYCTKYVVEGDTAVFFLTQDLSGEQYLRLKAYADSLGEVHPAPESFPYVEGYTLMFRDPEMGRIVAGLVRYKLAGIMRYNPDKHELLGSLWVKGLL